jgi:hypothetical protein
MDVGYFRDIECGESFIASQVYDGKRYFAWFTKLLEPTTEYNAVALDNGDLYFFKETDGVVKENDNC